jgi:hypothetical protein
VVAITQGIARITLAMATIKATVITIISLDLQCLIHTVGMVGLMATIIPTIITRIIITTVLNPELTKPLPIMVKVGMTTTIGIQIGAMAVTTTTSITVIGIMVTTTATEGTISFVKYKHNHLLKTPHSALIKNMQIPTLNGAFCTQTLINQAAAKNCCLIYASFEA